MSSRRAECSSRSTLLQGVSRCPVERIALAEAGHDGTGAVDDVGVLTLQGRRIEGCRCAEALRGGHEREPAPMQNPAMPIAPVQSDRLDNSSHPAATSSNA